MAAGGGDTIRGSLFDILRGADWPPRYTGRVLRNDFAERTTLVLYDETGAADAVQDVVRDIHAS